MLRSLQRSSHVFLFAALAAAAPSRGAKLELPQSAYPIIDRVYSGDLGTAIEGARRLEQERPDHPLGYLLEGEAIWWKIWCVSAEFKYGMTYPRHRAKLAADQHYLDLGAKVLSLAEAQIARGDSAEMEFYAGMGDALLARLYGLRGENRATARAGVHARERFQRALALDPELSDAYMGLGLYNYYIDTLSAAARFLRFFMGIPGGNKQEGIRQLKRAIAEGVLTPPEARFYLAINLHNYDQRYQEALQVGEALVAKYPSNPLFQLIRGDLYAKLGRKQLAAETYRSAGRLSAGDRECDAHIQDLVRTSLAALSAGEPAAAP